MLLPVSGMSLLRSLRAGSFAFFFRSELEGYPAEPGHLPLVLALVSHLLSATHLVLFVIVDPVAVCLLLKNQGPCVFHSRLHTPNPLYLFWHVAVA